MQTFRLALVLPWLFGFAACGASAPPAPARPAAPSAAFCDAIVTASDRDETDRALDAGRHPAETLHFFGIGPGMRVAEISAGGGYTAELLARAVAPGGTVYAHNAPFVLKRFAEAPWTARLTKPVMHNVVRLDREFADALPPEVKNLDAVLMVLFYHDTVWQGVDRERMNRMIFDALRPGGVYGIIDHSARPGRGLADVETLHRIDQRALQEEVEKAGLRLAATADFLRNPSDTRDWNDSPRAAAERRGTSDRFVLKYVKP
ncbi:MAG: class I SAM-dependent methyltransferase [Candidatus Binatia bacterium]